MACKDCGEMFTNQEVFETHLHQHALEDEEEEHEAQIGSNMDPAAELDSWCGNVDKDLSGGADGWDMSSTTQDEKNGGGLIDLRGPKVYSCSVCGKNYSYLVSFKKHQWLHENQLPMPITKSVQNLRKYECPVCGMSFIRRVRLLNHLRVHRSHKSTESNPHRCVQCNKDFPSMQSWMAHVVLHKKKPFWCLSCAQGFGDEDLLDKHLKKEHTGNSSNKTFFRRKIGGVKPYQCKFCGKGFFHIGNLISHRSKHLRVHVGRGGKKKWHACVSMKRIINRKIPFSTRVEQEPGTDTDELTEEEAKVEESKTPKLNDSDESDPSDESGPGLDVIMSQGTNVPREQKYREWECCVCSKGFDKVAELHLHYIKHATGELPM